MSKEITIAFDYCDYPSMSRSDFYGAIAMMEEAVEDYLPGVVPEVTTKGYEFGSGIIEVVCPMDTDEQELLEEIKSARNDDNDWKVGDSYRFEIL